MIADLSLYIGESKMTDVLGKIYVFGAEQTGKTELCKKLYNSIIPFTLNYRATIGADFSLIAREEKKNKTRLQIWDSAGQDRLKSLSNFVRGTDVAIYCVDLSKQLNLVKIAADLEQFRADTADSPVKIPIILVGTKNDDMKLEGQDEQFQALLGNPDYGFENINIKVSAKTNDGISGLLDELFLRINQLKRPQEEKASSYGSFFKQPSGNENSNSSMFNLDLYSFLVGLASCIEAAIVAIFCCRCSVVEEDVLETKNRVVS